MTMDSSNSISRKMSDADRAGFMARSPEGHAARPMNITGQEEVWINIQADTFKNWINVNLKEVGLHVDNLETDFQDGTKLVALVQVLQKRKLRHNKRPMNQHHELENISIALDAITEDGIRLVNIGNTDIHNGNLKLILGLLWTLIAHYQLGASNFPPKKLMLAWLKAVLPDCPIKNFTSDWNNGICLSALLDHCQPGLMPNWRSLNPHNGPSNCRRAMEMADKHFGIPMVLEPEYLSSPHLDELSGMTYLSYFMKEEDSPGYYATLNWVKKQIPNHRINNFRTDWNDGLAAAAIAKAKGAPVPGYRDMNNYPENWVSNLELALSGANRIGVPPVMEARDMANPNVEYLGVMAWVAQFQWIPDRLAPGDRLEIQCPSSKLRVGDECKFKVNVLDQDVDRDAITAEVIGPSGPVFTEFAMKGPTGQGSFMPEEMGMHEVLVRNDGEPIRGAPHFLRSMPQSKKDYDGIEPCAVGSTVEVLINPHHAARPELLEVIAYSPTGRPLGCPVSEENGTFYASFQPQEAGEWKIHVTYDHQDIDNSPFKCMVFNPRAITIPDQDKARKARPGEPFTFTVDASNTGWGEVAIDVVHENRSIRKTFYVEEIGHRIYQVTFTPQSRGKHRVYVYLHGMEVKGSPFSLRIGKDVRESRKAVTDIFRADKKVSRYKTNEESRAERRSYFTEKEIPIHAPVAPPRAKRDPKHRQSFREFQAENRQDLFQSDHRTDEGVDLLPVKKLIAFDCPIDDRVASADDIYVDIKGPDGKNCKTDIKISSDRSFFTCEFTTTKVGEHFIELIILGENVNVTPIFHTFDASKVKVGTIPFGYVGLPVEFGIESHGAGLGKPVVSVNGGRDHCHVASMEDGKFNANFIPHQPGRYRLDIQFNGQKVPSSPFFVEVKDPNAPLTSPGLVTGKLHPGSTNGHQESGESYLLKSKDFNQLSSSLDEELSSKLITTTTTTTRTKLEKTATTSATPIARNQVAKPPPPDTGPVIKASVADKKVATKMDPVKEFGTFSALLAPTLISGKSTSASLDNLSKVSNEVQVHSNNIINNSNNNNSSSSHDLSSSSSNYRRFDTPKSVFSSTTESTSVFEKKQEDNVNYSSRVSDTFKSNSATNGAVDINKMYSTTISKTVNHKPSHVVSGFREEEFIIKAATTNEPPATNKKPFSMSPSIKPSPSKSPSPPRSTSTYSSSSRLFQKERSPSPEPRPMSVRASKSPVNDRSNSSYSSSSATTATTATTAIHTTEVKQQQQQQKRSVTSPGKKGPSPQRSLIPKRTEDLKVSPKSSTSLTPAISAAAAAMATSSSKTVTTSKTSSSSGSVFASESISSSSIATSTTKSVLAKSSSMSNRSKPQESGPTAKAKGSTSPKLASYRGTADKCKFEGETVRHFKAGKLAVFELKAPGHKREDVLANIISPEKRPHIPYKVVDETFGKFRIEFTTVEVGSYVIDVTVNGLTVPNSPLIAKAYDAGLIKVTDISDGMVGVLSTFRVDASKAGEGQLEISINDGDVPNQVQVLGGGKCLVTYTPEQAITHEIEVTFNDEQVPGSPFLCRVSEGDDDHQKASKSSFASSTTTTAQAAHSKVSLDLEHLGLIPIHEPGRFTIKVAGGDDAELAVSVQGPTEDIPVKVTGNVRNGFTAEFFPIEVGIHMILVEYNGVAVGGTPFYCKVFDSQAVQVSEVPKSSAGKTVTFAVDASQAGEGNLEIFVVASDDESRGVATDVTTLGNAVFAVSFVPQSPPSNHTIYVTFNDQPVPGSPFLSRLSDMSDSAAHSNQSESSSHLARSKMHPTKPTLKTVAESRDEYKSDIQGSNRH